MRTSRNRVYLKIRHRETGFGAEPRLKCTLIFKACAYFKRSFPMLSSTDCPGFFFFWMFFKIDER